MSREASTADAVPVGTYARRLRDVDACVGARLPRLGGRALDVGCGLRLARGADGRLTPFAPTSEELAASLPALGVTAVDPALPEACVRVGDAWVIMDAAGRASACLLAARAQGDTVQLERLAHHPDGARLAALCRAELTPRAETWWREGREQAERTGRATVPLAIEQLGPLAALPASRQGCGPLVELLHRPVERHAESVGTSLTARKQTLEGLAASGAGEPFDLVRIANVTAFMPDGPAGALLRAAARVAREGAWLVEAGTVALGGEAVLTALALARNTGGVWSPRELWLSPAGTPTFLARGGAELPAVLGPAGPPLVRALVQADRALRSKGAEPDAPTMAAALQSLGHRASSAAGLPLVGLSVTT